MSSLKLKGILEAKPADLRCWRFSLTAGGRVAGGAAGGRGEGREAEVGGEHLTTAEGQGMLRFLNSFEDPSQMAMQTALNFHERTKPQDSQLLILCQNLQLLGLLQIARHC